MKKTVKLLALSLLLALLLGTLASCMNAPASDAVKAKEALKNNGYTVTHLQDSLTDKAALAVFELVGIEDLETVVSATNADGEHITIFYFEEAEDADEEWEDVKKYVDDEKKESGEESEWVLDKSGNMIFFGTKAAVKAAK